MHDYDNPATETLLAGYGRMARFLTDHGFPTSKSTLSKIGAPSVREQLPEEERLPVEGYWGVLPLAKPSRLLKYAWARMRQTRGKSANELKSSADRQESSAA
jgi:hypothetical protein